LVAYGGGDVQRENTARVVVSHVVVNTLMLDTARIYAHFAAWPHGDAARVTGLLPELRLLISSYMLPPCANPQYFTDLLARNTPPAKS
jgi:hypothetical protein